MTRQENIENRLARLVPAPQDELASKILDEIESLPTSPLRTVSKRESRRSRRSVFSTISAGLLGIVIGAAAMFLVMTFALPPKIEIREIVRVVAVEPPKPDVVEKETKPVSFVSEINPTGFRSPASSTPFDLDEIIDEAMRRQSRLMASRPPTVYRPVFREPATVMPRVEYREMMRQALESL